MSKRGIGQRESREFSINEIYLFFTCSFIPFLMCPLLLAECNNFLLVSMCVSVFIDDQFFSFFCAACESFLYTIILCSFGIVSILNNRTSFFSLPFASRWCVVCALHGKSVRKHLVAYISFHRL